MRQIFWQMDAAYHGDPLQGMIFFQDNWVEDWSGGDWPISRGWNMTWWDDHESDYKNLHLPLNWCFICLGE